MPRFERREVHHEAAWPLPMATAGLLALLLGPVPCAWPSRNSLTARACVISKRACAVVPTSSITWAFAGASLAPLSPTPTGATTAHLRRLRADPHRPRPPTLCPRTRRRGPPAQRSRAGLHYHRSVPGLVSLGSLPRTQRGSEAGHAAGSARQYPRVSCASPAARCMM